MPLSTLRVPSRDDTRKTRGQDGFATSFPAGDLHPLQHAGLSRRSPSTRLSSQSRSSVFRKHGFEGAGEAVDFGTMLFPRSLALLLIVLAPSLHTAKPIASLSFTGGEQGRILIQAKVNGQGPFPFVFDTGSINILSLDLVNKLGIPVTGKQKLTAFGGTVETGSAVLDSIQVGDFKTSETVTMPHALVTVIGGGPFTRGGPVGSLVGNSWHTWLSRSIMKTATSTSTILPPTPARGAV